MRRSQILSLQKSQVNMQLLVSRSYGVCAATRQQPTLRACCGTLRSVHLRPRAAAVSWVPTSTWTVELRHEAAQPSAHALQSPYEDPVPELTEHPTRSSFRLPSVLERAIVILALAVVLCLGSTGLAFARSGGRVGGSSFGAASSTSHSSGHHSSHSSSRSSSYSPSYSSSRSSFGSSSYSSCGPSSYSASSTPSSSTSRRRRAGCDGGSTSSSFAKFIHTVVWVVFITFLVLLIATAIHETYMEEVKRGHTARRHDPPHNASVNPQRGTTHTVACVQVAVLAVVHDIKAEMDDLAVKADTSTTKGLHALLQDCTKALQRHSKHVMLVDSSTHTENSASAAERKYLELAKAAQSTYDEETLVNYGGKPVRVKPSSTGGDTYEELMVITLVVAGRGALSLPCIKSTNDLEAVLTRLAALGPTELQAVTLTWTPQAQGDALSRKEVLEQFPQLKPII